MNGSIKLPTFGNSWFTVYGGGYARRPADMYGLSLRPKEPLHCSYNLPVVDFTVPKEEDLLKAMRWALKTISAGSPLYVGCTMGWGRTGTFLAALLKAWYSVPGEGSYWRNDPVEKLRMQYVRQAVETPEQARLIFDLVIPWDIKWTILRMKAAGWLKRGDLTNYDE